MKNGLWEVKDVRRITGLTGRELQYFDQTGVVPPAGFANHAVNRRPYKLYDEVGLARLQQVVMYYELGMTREQIRALMTSPDYNMHTELDILKQKLEEKRQRLDRYISAVEEMRKIGTRNGVKSVFADMDMEQLGRYTGRMAQPEIQAKLSALVEAGQPMLFMESLNEKLHTLASLDAKLLEAEEGASVLGEIISAAIQYMGVMGYVFVWGLFMSAAGEGQLIQDVAPDLPVEVTVDHGKAAMAYLKRDADIFLDELADVFVRHRKVIGKDFAHKGVTDLVGDTKELLGRHFGIRNDEEYSVLLEVLDLEPYTPRKNDLLYVMNALKFYVCNEE